MSFDDALRDLHLTGPIDLSRLVLLCPDVQNAEVCAEAMGTTAVAPGGKSLIEAARALRRHSSRLKLIVCGSDDFKAPGKPAAEEAASLRILSSHQVIIVRIMKLLSLTYIRRRALGASANVSKQRKALM